MPRAAFTLVEALLATAITAIAGSALLLGVSASVNSTRIAREQIIADGLAAQLMDEIAGKAYSHVRNAIDMPLGPTAGEVSGNSRHLYTDIGDYNGLRSSPPRDMWGVPIGQDAGGGVVREAATQVSSFLSGFRQEVDVYYVSPTDLQTPMPTGQSSAYKCVEVRIYVDDAGGARRLLTKQKRVFAHVPSV